MKLTTHGKKALLDDLYTLIDYLNTTLKFIKTDPEKESVEDCLRSDGKLLNSIREFLHNGGYDND